MHRNNHYLDALALACVAGHGVGQRLGTEAVITSSSSAVAPAMQNLPADWVYRYRKKW